MIVRGRRSRGGSLAAVALAGALLGTICAGAAGHPAFASTTTQGHVAAVSADAAVPAVQITLVSQTPVVATEGSTITLNGEVANTSTAAIKDLSVALRLSPTPVRSRAEIPLILAGTAGRTGVNVAGTETLLAAELAPGQRVSFTVSTPIADLHLPANSEVVVLGVEAVGDITGDGLSARQLGFTRTLLPWFPNPAEVAPTSVVWLYPLSSAPARTSENLFLDDHLADEVRRGGRLSGLLDAASEHPSSVSWVVDPALLESLTDMIDGYRVQGVGKHTTPGTGGADAAAWLARLTALTAQAPMFATAYGGPDVVALHRANLDLDIARATTTAAGLPRQILGRDVTGNFAWPPSGVIDDGTLNVLQASGTTAVVLSGSFLRPPPSINYTPSGSVAIAAGGSVIRGVVSDPAISALVGHHAESGNTAAALNDDPVVREQTALALLAMTTLELPSTTRTLVVAPALIWTSDEVTGALVNALSSTPWAVPMPLGQLLTAPPSEITRVRGDYSARNIAAELPPYFLNSVAQGRTQLAALRAVAPDIPDHLSVDFESALTRAESAAWRASPATGRELLMRTRAGIADEIAQVTIMSRAPVTLPGDQGVIPITIANDLDRPARVGVRLTGTPSVRFNAADIPAVTLAPGQKTTLEVLAHVVGTGPVSVQISLLSPDGQPFGVPVDMQVKSAAYAHAAGWVVLALFAVLAILLVRNWISRRSNRANSATEQGGPA